MNGSLFTDTHTHTQTTQAHTHTHTHTNNTSSHTHAQSLLQVGIVGTGLKYAKNLNLKAFQYKTTDSNTLHIYGLKGLEIFGGVCGGNQMSHSCHIHPISDAQDTVFFAVKLFSS